MIRINLMPRAEARRQAARQRDKQVATLIAAALAVLIVATEFFTRREANQVQAEADAYQAELADLTRRHMEATQLDKKRAQLRAKLETIEILERQRRGPVHVLDDLSSATPEKLWLTEMRESGGGVTLLGKGLDNQTIAQFMRRLGESRYFENVDLVETKQIEEGQAKLKQFTISARVNYAGRTRPAAQPAAGAAEGDERPATDDGAPQGPAGEAVPRAVPEGADEPRGAEKPAATTFAGGAGPVDGAGPLAGAVAARDAARGAAAATERHQVAEAAEAAAESPGRAVP
jgi:type IV pilus assembly protein PilN